MLRKNVSNGGKKIAIIIAPSFDEGPVVYCLDRLREAGISVSLISLSAGLITGAHGLSVRADYSLDRHDDTVVFRLLVLPGSTACSRTILNDPRIHKLLVKTWESGGYVAAMGTAAAVMNESRMDHHYPEQYLIQGDTNLIDFANDLLNLLYD